MAVYDCILLEKIRKHIRVRPAIIAMPRSQQRGSIGASIHEGMHGAPTGTDKPQESPREIIGPPMTSLSGHRAPDIWRQHAIQHTRIVEILALQQANE